MQLRSDSNGDTISVQTDVSVKTLFGTYQYALQSKEVWKAGKVVEVESTCDDDGKKHQLTAQAVANGLIVGKSNRPISLDRLVTTSGWYPPNSKTVVLFDTEDGSSQEVKVEMLEPTQISLGDRKVKVTRYRLKGGEVDSEWGYDEKGKLVQQSMAWDGHRVRLELSENAK